MSANLPTPSIPNLLWRLWKHLSRRRQYQFALLVILMVLSAFAEIVSLGAVVPFLGIMITPEAVFSHPIVAKGAAVLDVASADDLVLPLTILFMVAALSAGGIRLLFMWASTRLTFVCGADLSIKVYRSTLYQPYHVHLSRNSSEVISGILGKVGSAANMLSQTMTLMSSSVLLVTITIALIAIDPIVALAAIGGFGSSYAVITWIARRKLRINGQKIADEQINVLKALNEGLGGIRDVLLDGTQPAYCDIYRNADLPLRRAQGNNIFIGGSPRYVMEALGMVLIAALAYGLSLQPNGIAPAMPILGALALGAQRLLPALQQSYNSWSVILGNHASLNDAINLLDQPLPFENLNLPVAPLKFTNAVHFNNVRFRYSCETPWVLDGLDLTIPKGKRIGFVGSTGSGKSSTLDLLMGLLEPTSGELLIDGAPLTAELVRQWQRNIAHVPQSIYLADSSLAENIAFGVPRQDIDMDRVRQAARQAQMADFIESGSEGYDAFVGERGNRLSGGQRQRIGIARAFYKQADVLVFDEATSALDNSTEQSVMAAIEELNPDLTILFIAHRLSTVRGCDIIVELEQGKIVAQGTYEQLLKSSPSFQQMALSGETS